MKRKISRILGVAITLAMLTSLMVASTPAQSADPLKWGEELAPSSYTICVVGGLIPGTDVKDFAIALNGSTIYATLGTFQYPTPAHCFDPYDQKWYIAKSTMAGAMWSWVEVKDDDGDAIPTTSIDLVSIADDSADGSVAAIVYDGTNVAMTDDGGSIWIDLETPYGSAAGTTAATINCIDVNREVSGKRFVAVGGTDTNGDAGLWYMEMGATMPKWKDASVAGDGWDVSEFQASEAVLAMQFSPNYPSDRTMAIITGPVTISPPDTKVRLQLASFAGECWNKDQFGSTWESGGEDGQVIFDTTVNVTAAAASISLPTSFIASDDTARIFFVGVSSNETAVKGGVWRFEDDEQKEVEDSVNINSVAYNTDEDKLVAGEYFSNNVLRSDDPLSKEPDVYDSNSFKRPGVNGATSKIQVAWAGTTVFAGSQGTDSAFSKSTDDGKCFNDISLVDHDIGTIHDFVLNTDGSKVYILSDDGTDVMLWRGSSYFWTRVLTLENAATANFTVRIAPDDDNVVYVAELDSTTIYYSSDGGDSKWMYRYCGTNLVDLAVESTDSVYAVDAAGFVTKSTDGGFVWSDKVDTGLDHGATIVSLGEDKLLIGGTKGEVGYSTDGGDSWTKMSKVGAGKVQVCADGLDSGSNIYAATDVAGGDYVYRATLPGTSWTKMTEDRLTYPCYGIGLSDDGVLYAMTCKTGSGLTEITYAALPDNWTWTSANLSTTTIIPGSVTVLACDATFAAVNALLTDNDDPDDEDMNALCGSTGEVDYTPSATTGITVGFIETPWYISVTYNSSSYVHRCLTPTADEDDVVDAWSVIDAPSREFDSPAADMGPQALKITGNKLWAITKNDSGSAKLYSVTDSIHIASEGPPITQPEDGATLKVNKETGHAYDMIFQWDRPVKTAEEYELEIAYDSDFLAKIQTITVASEDPTVVVALGPYSAPPNADTIEYMPGETYYWRVRVTQPFFSPWSAVRSFSTEALAVVEPEPEPVLEPAVATPAFAAEGVSIKPTFSWSAIAGATYEFVLAEDLGLDDPFEIIDYSATCDINAHIAREDLKYSTTYHWRVRSISDAGTSEWVRGIFTTEAVPEEAAPPIVIEEKPAPPAPEIYLEVPPTPAPVQVIPDYLLWVIVVVGAVLIIAVIVLIVRTRRVT